MGWLNGSQIFALAVLLLAASRLQLRAWPFLVFGPIVLAAFLALIMLTGSPFAIVAATATIGIAGAVTMTAILALPPLLVEPRDVPRTAAGMFTVSYTCAVIIPTISGGLWDLTGKPWIVFAPLLVCSVTDPARGDCGAIPAGYQHGAGPIEHDRDAPAAGGCSSCVVD